MPGSDVDLLLNEVLPQLRPGVLIHLHDIFLPDPYPAGWAWRGYNEQVAVRLPAARRRLRAQIRQPLSGHPACRSGWPLA